MNTKLFGIIAAVVLLLGTGGLYFLNQNKSANNSTFDTSPTQKQNQTTSLLELLSKGGNQRCTFTTSTEKGMTEGTVYVSGEKMRGDIKTTVDGKTEEISMIRDGDTNYMWGTSLKMGIKMTISLDEFASSDQAGQFVSPDQKFDYNCAPWTTDNSLFTPPSNVKFTELPSSMMPKTTGTQGNINSVSYCDQITDPAAKAACVNAMSGQ